MLRQTILTAAVIAAALAVLSPDASAREQQIIGGGPPVRQMPQEAQGLARADVVMPAAIIVHAAADEGYRPPYGMSIFVVDATRSVLLPTEFAREIAEHTIMCESSWNTEAVNPQSGALGWLQIMPLHFPRMRAMRLDPRREADRLQFGAMLWRERGETMEAWECRR